jgi:hypothetical protein
MSPKWNSKGLEIVAGPKHQTVSFFLFAHYCGDPRSINFRDRIAWPDRKSFACRVEDSPPECSATNTELIV